MRRRGAMLLLVGLIVSLATSAWADINSQLDRVFSGFGAASVTRPGAYQSQAAGALMGGSASIRIPNETFNLLTVTPPRFSAGCGKIDLYLGSISFPSLSRFTDLLTQLGTSGVLGFAFQLALMELCQPCENIISKLEAAARAINTAGRLSPCQIGQELAKQVKGQPNSLGNIATNMQDAWNDVKEAGGIISDKFADWTAERGQTTTAAVANMATISPADDPRGNVVFQALTQAGFSNEEAEMVQSVTGTLVVGDDGIAWFKSPTLKFQQLLEAEIGQEFRLLKCVSYTNGCVEVDSGGTTTTLVGARRRANDLFQSIIDKVQVTKTLLTAAEQDLINSSTVPVYTMLVDYYNTPARAEIFRDEVSSFLGAQLAYQYMLRLARDVHAMTDVRLKQWTKGPNFDEFFKSLERVEREAIQSYQLELNRLGSGPSYTYHITQTLKKAPPRAKNRKLTNQ